VEDNWNQPNAHGDLREQAVQKAAEAKEQVRNLANAGKEQVADQIGAVARALRETGEKLRQDQETPAARYTEMIGEKAERLAQSLKDRDAVDLASEVEDFARTRPLVFLGGCLLAGFAIGRFLKASAPSAGPSSDLTLGRMGFPDPEAPVLRSEVRTVGRSSFGVPSPDFNDEQRPGDYYRPPREG
jgi:hypothetical protein